MSAQQATADGGGYQRGHKQRGPRGWGGCHSHRQQRHHRHHRHDRSQNGERCDGVIGRTTRGISEAFGIPRKGVLIAFVLILVFSFPVGVMLFALAWAYVHHPDWFAGLRGKWRGASGRARYDAKATSESAASEERPTMGVDFEEPWMDELRRKFDDLERRTGSMEGFVASGDYGLASELEQMKKADASNDAQGGASKDAKDKKDTGSSPNDKA
ncbi:PspC domain-containing protein [Thalassospira lucentensis]|uniref:PspC domain-containing protein n=1 Tax=Thalassospira lucentensis TaxID=168935 RepID=UPI003AA7D4D2